MCTVMKLWVAKGACSNSKYVKSSGDFPFNSEVIGEDVLTEFIFVRL